MESECGVYFHQGKWFYLKEKKTNTHKKNPFLGLLPNRFELLCFMWFFEASKRLSPGA